MQSESREEPAGAEIDVHLVEGIDEQGEPIIVVDALRDELMAIAGVQRQNPLAFIENRLLFGDLADDERFAAAYLAALTSLFERGAHATVSSFS